MQFNLEDCTITIGGVDLGEFVHGDLLQVTIRTSKVSQWKWRWLAFRATAAAYKARMRYKARIRKYWSAGQLWTQLATFPRTTRDDRLDAFSYAIWAGIGESTC